MATHDPQAQPILDALGGGLFGATPNSATRALTGLALDIGTDPTSYIGPSAIKGVLKGAGLIKGATGLLEGVNAALDAAHSAAYPIKTAYPANTYLHTAHPLHNPATPLS